jgi:Sel1 repeat
MNETLLQHQNIRRSPCNSTSMQLSFIRNLIWILPLLAFSWSISIKPLNAQVNYSLLYDTKAFPIKTQLLPTQLAEFDKIFQLTKLDPKTLIAIRAQLQPLAEVNDPVASYWLAQTYDWTDEGVLRSTRTSTALKWYRKSAELNYGTAAYFLFISYLCGCEGLKRDDIEATKWLNKSKELATGKTKAHILVDFAIFSDPHRERLAYELLLSTIPQNTDAHLQYLDQAYAIDPYDTWVADYYGSSLYEAKRYKEALPVMRNSNSGYTWQKIGHMYEQGIGTLPSLSQALFWYKKMVMQGKNQENFRNIASTYSDQIRWYGKREIYRLLCLKKITKQQAAPVYSPDDYQEFFGRWSDAKCNFIPG